MVFGLLSALVKRFSVPGNFWIHFQQKNQILTISLTLSQKYSPPCGTRCDLRRHSLPVHVLPCSAASSTAASLAWVCGWMVPPSLVARVPMALAAWAFTLHWADSRAWHCYHVYMGRFCMTVKWPNPGLFYSDFGRLL